MVDHTAARRPYLWNIVRTFGLLALLGTAIMIVVFVREPAFPATHLTAPVPAPEITVVDEDPSDGGTDALAEPVPLAEPDGFGGADPGTPAAGPSSGPVDVAHRAPHSAEDVQRSLFWSGVFGLAISLAGLGLVGTRRRRW